MKFRGYILAGAAFLALMAPAHAAEGWYLGLGAGWDTIDHVRVTGAGLDGKLRSSGSPIAEATFGYKFGDFRLETETAWDRHKIENIDSGGIVGPIDTGRFEMRSALVNGIYDIHLLPRLKISLGAGAGAGNDTVKFFDPAVVTTFSNGDRMRFMWQAIGGLSFQASRHFELFVEYHYRDLLGTSNISPLAGSMRTHNVNEQAVIAGLRWYSWAPEPRVAYQPPPAPPYVRPAPPPPLPPAPPPVKTFIVFFDFNKSSLTPEATNVVGEAVKEAKSSGAVRVLVTGHTDTVGSDVYNQALSVRRAQSVKDQMISDGMGGSAIAIEGKSFHDPLVATGPGVREPQNRRAVIDLGG
jgi:OmpA-OmpF porin, OOP family